VEQEQSREEEHRAREYGFQTSAGEDRRKLGKGTVAIRG
jgi:hypothetical protein